MSQINLEFGPSITIQNCPLIVEFTLFWKEEQSNFYKFKFLKQIFHLKFKLLFFNALNQGHLILQKKRTENNNETILMPATT